MNVLTHDNTIVKSVGHIIINLKPSIILRARSSTQNIINNPTRYRVQGKEEVKSLQCKNII